MEVDVLLDEPTVLEDGRVEADELLDGLGPQLWLGGQAVPQVGIADECWKM
jgi:hypothetical protein